MKIENKDIKAIREYRNRLEALKATDPPGKLTPDEWDEAMKEIQITGIIPAKYEGRIGETETQNSKAYYDISEKERDEEYNRLEKKYHNSIIKALNYYFNHRNNLGANITDILGELLEDPDIKQDLETEAKTIERNTLAPLGRAPSSEALALLNRALAAKKGRGLEQNPANRNEIIEATETGSHLIYTRKNKNKKSEIIIDIDQTEEFLRKTNKTFSKMLLFTLQKMTAQNFSYEIGFSLHELVSLGMYSNIDGARKAFKDFFDQQKRITISGTVYKGKKCIREKGGVLFYNYDINNGFVTLSVNEKFNTEFIATYFTYFPRFAYALSNNAFALVQYIFYLARQKGEALQSKGSFKINLDYVRDNLGLPSVEEIKNRKYKQYIIDPIKKAIKEVEEALQNEPETEEGCFTLALFATDTNDIREWLKGYLEIGLNGSFADKFIQISGKQKDLKAN